MQGKQNLLNKYKACDYKALRQSSEEWKENKSSYFFFLEHFLSALYARYKELNKRFTVVHGKEITQKARSRLWF